MDTIDINANNNNSESDHSEGQSPSSPAICYGCKLPIQDEYRLRVSPDLEWHAACLVCCVCSINLDENCTCFLKDGKPFCKKDYVRMFGMKCNLCLAPITDTVMSARNQAYHKQCYCCASCEKTLLPGEEVGMHNNKFLCKSDLDLIQNEQMDSPTDTMSIDNYSENPIPTPTLKSGGSTAPSGSTNGSNNSGGHSNSGTNSNNTSGATTKRSNSEKGPRVRTVLSEQQLQTLRTVYASNPRPDALMKEHLVEITGLSPRVIRVWFQNKRCKDKKKLVQQADAARLQQQQQQQALQPGTAASVLPPLTPQTPLTPDSMGQISPHPGMPAFTYPPAPSSYDAIPSTPTQTAVSPIVTYQQNSAWTSPTSALPHFDPTVDYSSPMSTADQPFVFTSTAITSHPNTYF